MDSRSVVGESCLIGSDVFENFLVDLDFPNEKLRLSELRRRPGETESKLTLNNGQDEDADESDSGVAASDSKPGETKSASASGPQDRYLAPEMKEYTTFYRFGRDVLVPTAIGNVTSKLFLLDTDALMNAISPEAGREVTKTHADNDMIVKGISGRVDKVYSADRAVLRFGHLRQENQDMTAFDTKRLSDGAGTKISGFLGFSTLRFLDVKIDYRDGLVDFQFDSKRFGR